ncbi:MAG: ABC transporter ATP-binding protein [Chitinivibrionales bacterium]|nr:ABC transporter ATP-binding protein [Chitinivibrionales bacterium]
MINVDSVTKRFGAKVAVDNASFSVTKGHVCALLGPNGAGKTTLLRMIMGFSFPGSGTITIAGIAADQKQSRSGVSFVADNHVVPPSLTAWQYLMRSGQLCGMPQSSLTSKITVTLQTMGLTASADKAIRTFSKGMVQRVALAAAILTEPKLLILDEPVSGLDPYGIKELRQMIEQFKAIGTTVLISSHILSEVEKVADSVVLIAQGRIIACGSLSSLLREGESVEDFFMRSIEESHAKNR